MELFNFPLCKGKKSPEEKKATVPFLAAQSESFQRPSHPLRPRYSFGTLNTNVRE